MSLDKCCICLEEVNNEKNLVVFGCGHHIHFSCFCKMVLIDSSVKHSKCPLCRSNLVSRELLEEIKNLVELESEPEEDDLRINLDISHNINNIIIYNGVGERIDVGHPIISLPTLLETIISDLELDD